jgi:internalin A
VQAFSCLVNLTSLNLSDNEIGDEGVQALGCLVKLASLDLRSNKIGNNNAQALSPLVNLASLDLGWNEIGADGARALSSLVNLTSLDLAGNAIGADGAQALGQLVNLTRLDLAMTGVRNLSPLLSLTKLESLNCSGCELDDAFVELWQMPSLNTVALCEATLPGVPAEVLWLAPEEAPWLYGDNCLERLRAHFACT